MDYLLAAVVVITMVTSLQAVGTLLAIGLLVAPAATLYLYLDSPRAILWGGGVDRGRPRRRRRAASPTPSTSRPARRWSCCWRCSSWSALLLSPRYGLLAVLRGRYAPYKH